MRNLAVFLFTISSRNNYEYLFANLLININVIAWLDSLYIMSLPYHIDNLDVEEWSGILG